VSVNEIPDKLLDAILDVVGDKRTIMIPTFTFSYPKSRKFHLIETKSDVGVLGETLLKRSGAIRTISAIYSYAVKGPQAEVIRNKLGNTVWGQGSIMGWLEEKGARICTLGLPFEAGVTIAHRAEEIAQVPYRYYKCFKGTWDDGFGNIKPWMEVMFVRTLTAATDYEPITKELEKRQLLLEDNMGKLLISSAKARDIINITLKLLKDDPLVLVRNKAYILNWIRNGRDYEINQLKPEERPPL